MEENFRDLLGFHHFKSFSIKKGHDGRYLFLQLPNTLLKQEQDCTQGFSTSLGNSCKRNGGLRSYPMSNKEMVNQFACASHRLI